MRPRFGRRPAVVAMAVAATLGVAAPPVQAREAREVREADFAAAAQETVAEVLPGHPLRERATRSLASPLAEGEKVRLDTATFAGGGRVLLVARGVGAVREVARRHLPPGSQVVAETTVRRPGAGSRRALITSTADRWGPGLTVLSWSERRGVNYQIAVRGTVTRDDLLRLARALPKDGADVPEKVRSLVARAAPPGDSGVDAVDKNAEFGTFGLTNKVLDGAGAAHDDFGNEATLCNGCTYWSGNWAGLFQHLLYADGRLAYSSIDCMFGAQTASATVAWQRAEGLTADGVAGPDTLGRMDNYLTYLWTDQTVDYVGRVQIITMVRVQDIYYYGPKITYGYGGGTLPGC
ncbi:peptidoglycan-binding domain-containing protein [Thermomonospora cellulosilytica]|uniref:Peptidoglycan hydrolase-like protein with peptidoglycan-binding domain n=1 Tax=Thermomonospora cellulosilytica TaxID=1411118 RepID=A0A7W3R8S8_9ACTN|nr:peptidoglycan-binding protein [Thermomonospora cellulosilytica]MBA9004633.1 peptidoglycan hydrolase-like protein with peptidoglycan-binding domain [Thermomonospora cellulosilytica]